MACARRRRGGVALVRPRPDRRAGRCGGGGGVVALWAVDARRSTVRSRRSLGGLLVVVIARLPVPGVAVISRARGFRARPAADAGPHAARGRPERRAAPGTWAGLMWMYMWVGKLPGGTSPDAQAVLQIASSIGAAIGCYGRGGAGRQARPSTRLRAHSA